MSGYPHWLVGQRSIGATASPNCKQYEKDTIGYLQGHRRDTATVRNKAHRAIFGSLTKALSNLTLDLHRAPCSHRVFVRPTQVVSIFVSWNAPMCFPRIAIISVKEAKQELVRMNRNAALTISKEFQWHCHQMLSSRVTTMNSFDASAIVAVGIIVAQLLLG